MLYYPRNQTMVSSFIFLIVRSQIKSCDFLTIAHITGRCKTLNAYTIANSFHLPQLVVLVILGNGRII